MKNNIFDYATSELSQDAFICWCVNWFNDCSRPALREMAETLVKLLSGVEHVESVRIYRQFSRKAVKIDVLLVVNEHTAVIVEDKTYTSEHGNQISVYRAGLERLIRSPETEEALRAVTAIRTVYFKTGFFYDYDKTVKADAVVNGNQFLGLLTPYRGNSEILDSYIESLSRSLEWYDTHGDYTDTPEDFWSWNIVWHQIAQYRLMRHIFPEELWKNRESCIYRIDHGSNIGGRPWTELNIMEGTYPDTKDRYYVFWRIDTDHAGPYLSLRFYESLSKKGADYSAKKLRHKSLYEVMSNLLCRIVNDHQAELCFTWNTVYPGYRGNYMESDLLHLCLREPLRSWPAAQDAVTQSVRKLTKWFLAKMDI